MRYALLIHYQQPPAINLKDEDLAAGKAAFHAYTKALDDAGALRSAEILQTVSSATSVSVKQGKLQVQDGPFADTKEKLGGIFVIEVDNLDEALKWAQRNPANGWGWIEIRPVARTYAADRGWYNP